MPQLSTVAEKALPAKCKELAYCPTMDLIATATEDEHLHVFRFNGQRVLDADFAGDPYLDENGELRSIAWKEDGHLLAVGDGQNKLRLISSYNGRTVHNYSCRPPDAGTAKITCLGWGVNFTDSKAAYRHLQESDGALSAEDLLAPDTHPQKAVVLLKADLPRELALLDMEGSLPKLSTLPATGAEDDVFSSRASIDAIFHSNRNSSDSVDVLLVGFEDGTIHIRIFDCFEIGSIPVSPSAETLLYASQPMSSTHALLVAESPREESESRLKLFTVDLRFITKSGRYLSLLASKVTQFQNLLRYISQVQRQIQLEWKNIIELPARYMRSVTDELQTQCHCDFVTAMYHLVVTGHCYAPLKEFLTDIVGDRGQKRWEKTVSGGYENIRRLSHECLLPALERSQVLLSRLIGISKFQKLGPIFGLETRHLQEIVETVDCLHLLVHKILLHSGRELQEFIAFSRWLQHEIAVQSAEPMSQTLEDLIEKSDLIDHGTTLAYIRGPLTRSALRDFIGTTSGTPGMSSTEEPSSSKWASGEQDGSFYEFYRRMLALHEQHEANPDASQPVELPKLTDLIGRLERQCDRVFAQIALAQRRSILHRCSLVLHPESDRTVLAMTMTGDNYSPDRSSIYVATRLKNSPHTLCIYRLSLESVNGVSSTKETSVATLSLQQGEIKQVQFVQDGTIMVLYTDAEGHSSLLQFPSAPQDSDHADSFYPSYQTWNVTASSLSDLPEAAPLDFSTTHAQLVLHAFPSHGPKSRPGFISVNGRNTRRAVCVLYADALHYEVLDMDSRVEDG